MRSVLHELRTLTPARQLRLAEAIRIAELQANRLLQIRDIAGPPVPSELVTKFPRVRLEKVYPLAVSGATIWSAGSWQILINAGEPATRQRFSALHELKHVIDHQVATVAYPAVGGMSSYERQEQICDYFAAAVLMPRLWVKRAWTSGIQDVRQLARLFDVSREAMRYRLTALGLVEQTRRCEVAA